MEADTKRCAKCGLLLALGMFNMDRAKKCGLASYCKQCNARKSKLWCASNPEKRVAGRLADYAANSERYKQNARRWAKENKERVYAKVARWNAAHPECAKQRWIKNKARYYEERRLFAEQNPEVVRAWRRKKYLRLKGDITHRLRVRISNQMRKALKSHKGGASTSSVLGYGIAELRSHLERQFTNGMNWENMAEWHIDHIIPLSSFTLTSFDDPNIRKAWALPNLRPLWASENCSKGAKITSLL